MFHVSIINFAILFFAKADAVGAMCKLGVRVLFELPRPHKKIVCGFCWANELRLASRRTSSSVNLGIGPSRQPHPPDLSAAWSGDTFRHPISPGTPVGGMYLIVAGRCFCTHEIELSLTLRRHISFDAESGRVTWNDPRAIGEFRSWDCV